MTDSISPLYAELLGETARISWGELAPWFAKGQLLWVSSELDLVAVAEAVASDNKKQVSSLMQQKRLARLDDACAVDYQERDPELWATVVSPWVLVQERSIADNPGIADAVRH